MPIEWASGYSVSAEAFSEKESWDIRKPPEADVKLRVGWSNRHAVMASILGARLQWPYYTSVPLYAVSAAIEPVGNSRQQNDGGEGNAYAQAFVNVHFDPFTQFTEQLTPHGEMIKLDRFGKTSPEASVPGDPMFTTLAWKKSETQYVLVSEEESPTKLITGYDYVVNFESLDVIPSEILTLVDHTNESSCTGINLELTFDPETLLLTAAPAKHSVAIDGSVTNSLEISFSWRQNTWNKFWRKDTQAWESQWITYTVFSNAKEKDGTQYTADEVAEYKNFPPDDFSSLLPT